MPKKQISVAKSLNLFKQSEFKFKLKIRAA